MQFCGNWVSEFFGWERDGEQSVARRKGRCRKAKRDEECVGGSGKNYRKSETESGGRFRGEEHEERTDVQSGLSVQGRLSSSLLVGMTARCRGSNRTRRRNADGESRNS
jgi:hypothetical protein